MKPIFSKLVRFRDTNNEIFYGEAPTDTSNLVGQNVPIYTGSDPWDLKATEKTAVIAAVTLPSPP